MDAVTDPGPSRDLME